MHRPFPQILRAIIRENQDPEKLGRVRVEYPFFQGSSSEKPSEWASVCLPFASADAGFWFVPEVGDEVVVYVESGNLDHPLVIGTVYSGKTKPPASGRAGDFNSDQKNTVRYIKTKSGHLLCFDDADSSRAILLTDKDGNQVSITKEEVKVTNKGGDQVSIKSGAISIQAQSVKIEAASSLELGTGASEALVKGQAFMTFFNSHTHTSSMSGNPTSPPVAPMTPAQLSQKVKTA